MRNWLVLERRFETRTIASWPPTVRGWTACTPTLLHDTSAIMPPTTMIVPCAFQYSCFLFLSMKKFINNDTTHTCACWIMKIYVFLAKRLKQLHLLLIHTTLRSHLITYRVTQIRDADFKRWIIWYIICEVLVEVVTIENIILFKFCVRAKQTMLVRLLIWRCVYVFVLALNEYPELDWCVGWPRFINCSVNMNK